MKWNEMIRIKITRNKCHINCNWTSQKHSCSVECNSNDQNEYYIERKVNWQPNWQGYRYIKRNKSDTICIANRLQNNNLLYSRTNHVLYLKISAKFLIINYSCFSFYFEYLVRCTVLLLPYLDYDGFVVDILIKCNYKSVIETHTLYKFIFNEQSNRFHKR